MPLLAPIAGGKISGLKELERGESDSGSGLAKAAMMKQEVTWASTNNLTDIVAPPDKFASVTNLYGTCEASLSIYRIHGVRCVLKDAHSLLLARGT